MEAKDLIQLTDINRQLVEVTTVDEAKGWADKAEAARYYAKKSGMGLEAQNHAAEIKLRFQRKEGELLRGLKEEGRLDAGGRPGLDGNRSTVLTGLDDMGISKNESSQVQAIAAMPEEKFEEAIQEVKESGGELTTGGMVAAAKGNHRAKGTGKDEWFTPLEWIERARAVMGGIDLDPASTDKAQEIVKATRYFSEEENGLEQEWGGRVWLNPPYSNPGMTEFIEKFIFELDAGRIKAAVVLTHNCTETRWFAQLAGRSTAICFPSKRLGFYDINGEKAAPVNGQAFFLFGANDHEFAQEFGPEGIVVKVLNG